MNVGSKQLVQLGPWEVDAKTLDAPGAAWNSVVPGRIPTGTNSGLPPKAGSDFPSAGWRVVGSAREPWAEEVLILGAPSVVAPGRWVLVQLAHLEDGWSLAAPLDGIPVPTRESRRQGLRLHWDRESFECGRGSIPILEVVLQNDADIRWTPTELDTEYVHGRIFDHEGRQLGSGWHSYGKSRLLPTLAPGEGTRLSVTCDEQVAQKLPQGSFQVVAYLSAMGLSTKTRAGLIVD